MFIFLIYFDLLAKTYICSSMCYHWLYIVEIQNSKITLLRCYSVQAANISDCRIESKKIHSVARIESNRMGTFFAGTGML